MVLAAPQRLQIYAITTVVTLLLVLRICYSYYVDPVSTASLFVNCVTQAAQNETLGFGKVFYVSLPYRTDRQDAMELLAATSNITLTYQPGVLGSTMHSKAKPEENGFLRDEQWGCWRSHANAWKRVIDEKLETALILEDDVDWDVNVHDVFQELSKELRKGKLRRERMSAEEWKAAPYGFDWDILYVGTCWDIPRDPRPRHVTYYDPNAPGRGNLTETFVSELEGWGLRVRNTTHKRVIAPSWYPICTIGYAVTQLGAQRLLYNVGGVKGIGSGLDLAMNDQVMKGFLKAYTVVPPLITTWKTGGVRDSDIDDMKEKEKELKEGETLEVGSRNLWASARERMNKTLGNLIDV